MSIGYVIAALAAGAGFFIHAFVGSRKVVQPLLVAPDLPPASRWLMFLCWHFVTLALVALAFGFGWAAAAPEGRSLGLALTGLTSAAAALTFYVCTRARFSPWKVPPFVLFSLMAVTGAWAAFG